MKRSKLRTLLNNLDIEENEYTLVSSIKTILLTTNQSIDCWRDYVCFDTSNDLVKIKQYNSEGKNGKLINFNLETDNRTLRANPGNVIYMLHPGRPFRAPKTNDAVLGIDKNGNITLKGIIIATNGYSYITLDRDFVRTQQDTVICYTDANVEDYVQDPSDKTLFLKFSPITDLETDIYLDSNLIIGFEMTSARVGNS